MLTKGIITIATGNERYYKMALYLLYSLRISNPEMKMAIITDKQNLCTNEFDDVVILEEPHKSYLDKLDLLIRCPYDENIFIDADSLVFSNIDYLWKCFEAVIIPPHLLLHLSVSQLSGSNRSGCFLPSHRYRSVWNKIPHELSPPERKQSDHPHR